MASTELPTAPDEGQRLYSAWRYARAQWEMVSYSPAYMGADLPDDLDAMHCEADHTALLEYLLHPAASMYELTRKLRVIREEEAYNFDQIAEIVGALGKDASAIERAEAEKGA